MGFAVVDVLSSPKFQAYVSVVFGSGSLESADEKLTVRGPNPFSGVAVMTALGARFPPDGAMRDSTPGKIVI